MESPHKMLEPFDPAYLTLFAELGDRVSDAGLIEGLPPGGTFELRSVNGREYWYHRAYNRATGKDTVRYVGPATAALSARIERHRSLKPDIRGRRQLVSTLKRAGFPAPDTFTGEVLAAMARAGLFRLRADFEHKKKIGRREWVRAYVVHDDATGVAFLRKFPRQGAGILTSVVQSDGLVELGEDVTHLKPGEAVDFLPFSEVGA